MVATLIKDLVDGIDLGDIHAMTEHHKGVCLALLNHGEKFLPVEVDGSLTVTDEADTALHQGADVEVVGLREEKKISLLGMTRNGSCDKRKGEKDIRSRRKDR